MAKGRIEAFECTRCGHTWFPRQFDEDGKPVEPKKCPNRECGSPYWKSPRMTKEERAERVRRRTKAYWRERRKKEK